MVKKIIGVLVASLSLFFIACGAYWEEKGMFSEIEKEIKLEKPDVIGNIFSILEYNGELLADGGVIYHKGLNAVRGWSEFSGAPYGQVIRLAAGHDGTNEWLYALCAKYKEYRVYGRNPDSGWQQVSVDGAITTIFSNNAVSVGGSAGDNRAFVTTSTGIYELQGISAVAISATDTANSASADSKGAVYIVNTGGGNAIGTHFSNNPAFASDGTHLFPADQVSASDITALWACNGVLYIGTKTGPYQATYDASGNLGGTSDIIGENAEATFNGYANGVVFARFSGGRTDIYISAIGRGSTFASKNNGLWGYYSDRNNWNRE